ncbi:MAG: patatin-like phospholipase family protein, partial [Clostridiales bacterium]|nr:patatin-like phospholipase family protein [Clostridiales bacterium]
MKRAIVFAGGGSKGSYEMGVWTALNELGIYFDIATGTSIGSINAGLYAQNDYEKALELWAEMDMSHVMVNGININKNILSLVDHMDSLRPFLKSYLGGPKGGDITPFIETLDRYADEKKFFSSNIDYGIITVKFPSLVPVEIKKSDIQPGYFKRWIIASCSCFPVFPTCEVDGQSYIDGGYYDNLPIATALRLGADEVVAVDLNTDCGHPNYTNNPKVKYIRPSRDLGTFLCFERSVIEKNIVLGYNDAMKFYGKYCGAKYTFNFESDAEPLIDRLSKEFTDTMSLFETEQLKELPRLFARNAVNAPCTQLISELYNGKPLDRRMYFIGALEITASVFGIEPDSVYT